MNLLWSTQADKPENKAELYGGLALKAQSLPHLLELQAAERGNCPFIQTWNEGVRDTISFQHFNDRVVAVSRALQTQYGVDHNDRCGILSHNSPLYLATSFGIMRARAVSVNLNWRSPALNLIELVNKSGCKFVFASKAFEETAKQLAAACHSIKVVFLEDVERDSHAVEGSKATNADAIPCEGSDHAAVFFTSGSTSMPKAVPHTHRSLMWLAASYFNAFPGPYQNPDAGTLCFFPYFHVMGKSLAPAIQTLLEYNLACCTRLSLL